MAMGSLLQSQRAMLDVQVCALSMVAPLASNCCPCRPTFQVNVAPVMNGAALLGEAGKVNACVGCHTSSPVRDALTLAASRARLCFLLVGISVLVYTA